MKYAIKNAAGSLEVRQDGSTVLPTGGRLLNATEYDQLISGKFELVNDVVVDYVMPAAQIAAMNAHDKAVMIQKAFDLRDKALSRLSVLAGIAARAGNTAVAAACDAASTSLLGITDIPSVVAATDGASTKAAIMVEWHAIVAALTTASPASASVFVGLGL